MMPSAPVSIFLSIHGDSEFLREFLDSLAAQTCRDFVLRYRFDGPVSPQTEALMKRYPFASGLTDRRHVGVVASYRMLLDSDRDCTYCMFADQDDVWKPNKVSDCLAAIKKAEAALPGGTPVLVHSDLRVVDESLRPIAASMVRYQSLNPARTSLADLMIQNNVTGCTVICNRALADLANIPAEAICHDWYLALIAAAFGSIVFLPTPLVDYRQHKENVYGAVKRGSLLKRFFQREHLHSRVELTRRQAGAFLEQFRATLTPEQAELVGDWSRGLTDTSYFRRLGTIWRHGFRKNDWLRTIGLWWAA